MRLYRHELKMNIKSFLIWTIAVGGMCFGCILLYSSVESSLSEVGDIFSQMGAMSTAFGMDRLSISTMTGYFATEIAMLHALGGAMFGAVLGSNLLSKEEFGHTIEFLAVLPITRGRILFQKYLAMVSYLFLFQAVSFSSYLVGFTAMGEEIPWKHMGIMAGTQLLMLIEVATICFGLSAFSRRNMMGAGLGIALLFFAADMMCRVVPAIEDLKFMTPFYYCNATDIFTDTELSVGSILVGAGITILAFCLSCWKYLKKDFSA